MNSPNRQSTTNAKALPSVLSRSTQSHSVAQRIKKPATKSFITEPQPKSMLEVQPIEG